MRKRQLSIDFARGIAIILVVVGHACNRMNPEYYAQYLELPDRMIFSFVMPFFFMVSAAFVRLSLGRENFSDSDFLTNITKKLLLPFYSLGLVFFALNLIVPESLLETPSAKEMIVSMMVMQTNGNLMPSGTLWFLFTLFSFSFLTFVFIRKLKIDEGVLFVLAICLKLYALNFSDIYFFGVNKLAMFYVFYVFGYIISGYIINGEKIKRPYPLSFLILCWALSFFSENPYFSTSIMSGVFGSILLINICSRIKHTDDNRLFRFIYMCGEDSLLIFVFHMPINVLSRKLIYYFNLSDSIFGLQLMIIAGIFVPLILGKILSFNKSVYKMLLGRYPSGYLYS